MKYDFQNGEILLVNKPLGWTSFDVVNKLRWNLKRKLNIKKIKVGHAGTLDPLATGLLIICTGKKTKLAAELTAQNKTYTGKFLIGKSTPSYDLETEFDNSCNTDLITTEQIQKVAEQFIGEQLQTPPIFSAKKIDGKRAYESARAGKTVEMKQNQIIIETFKVDAENFPEVKFEISCSKGTYIRSIAHDFGLALENLATLIELNRTVSGDFKLEDAKSVEEWIAIINEE